MTTQERINTEYIREVKAKNRAAVSTLRMLRTAIKYAEIDKRELLEEDEVIEVIGREAKKMRDAVESYRSADRQDMVDSAEVEIEILQSYLPQPLDEATLKELVKTKVAEIGASTPKDMGRVMAEVMKEAKGKADGSKVSALVKEALIGGNS